MILFLTQAFQLRLRLGWKPDLTGLLIGDRNHYFYTPETLVEVPKIDAFAIEEFLSRKSIGAPWQLLGFLAPHDVEPFSGYAQVNTSGIADPSNWSAVVYLMQNMKTEPAPLQIRIAGRINPVESK